MSEHKETLTEALEAPWPAALYKDMDMGSYYCLLDVRFTDLDEHYSPLPAGELREVARAGYVRVSEIVRVSLISLPKKDIIAKVVASLNQEEREVLEKLNKKLADIRDRRNQILAIGYEGSEDKDSIVPAAAAAEDFDNDIPFEEPLPPDEDNDEEFRPAFTDTDYEAGDEDDE